MLRISVLLSLNDIFFSYNIYILDNLNIYVNIPKGVNMANTTNREVKVKHRKRKKRITRQNQESIALNAKKKTLEKLQKEGRLPKIALGRL